MHPLTLGDDHVDDAARWHPALAVLGVLAAALAAVLLPTTLAQALAPTDVAATATTPTTIIDGRSTGNVNATVSIQVANAHPTDTVVSTFAGTPGGCTNSATLTTASRTSTIGCTTFPTTAAQRLAGEVPVSVLFTPSSPSVSTATRTVSTTAALQVFNGTLVGSPLGQTTITEGQALVLSLSITNSGNVAHVAPAINGSGVLLDGETADSCSAITGNLSSGYVLSCTWEDPDPGLFDDDGDPVTLSAQVRPTGQTFAALSSTIDLSDLSFETVDTPTTSTPTTPTTPTEPPVTPDPEPEIDDPNADLELPGFPETETPESGVADAGADAESTVLASTGARLTLLLVTIGLIALLIGWRMTVYTDERDGFIRVQ